MAEVYTGNEEAAGQRSSRIRLKRLHAVILQRLLTTDQ